MKEIVIGVYVISNFGGVEILEINGDIVKWRYNFGEPQEIKESGIEFYYEDEENEDGEEVAGFFADGTFVAFNEVLRVRQ